MLVHLYWIVLVKNQTDIKFVENRELRDFITALYMLNGLAKNINSPMIVYNRRVETAF